MDKISIEKKTTTYDPALKMKTTVTKHILRYESKSLNIPVAVVVLTYTKIKDLPTICSYHVYPVLKKILPHDDRKIIDDAKISSNDSDTAYVIKSMDILSESNIAGENFIEEVYVKSLRSTIMLILILELIVLKTGYRFLASNIIAF